MAMEAMTVYVYKSYAFSLTQESPTYVPLSNVLNQALFSVKCEIKCESQHEKVCSAKSSPWTWYLLKSSSRETCFCRSSLSDHETVKQQEVL